MTASASTRQPVRLSGSWEGDRCFAGRVGGERGIPVANELEERAELQVRATATAGVGAFLLELLAADEAQQQVVIAHIERVKRVKAFVRIKIATAAADEVEDRLVEHCHSQLDRRCVALTGADMQIDCGLFTGFVDGLARLDVYYQFFGVIAHLGLHIAHTECRFPEIHLAILQRLVQPRRHHHHRQVEPRKMIGGDGHFHHFQAVGERA